MAWEQVGFSLLVTPKYTAQARSRWATWTLADRTCSQFITLFYAQDERELIRCGNTRREVDGDLDNSRIMQPLKR